MSNSNRNCKIDFTTWTMEELRHELEVLENQDVPGFSHYDQKVITAINNELTRRTK